MLKLLTVASTALFGTAIMSAASFTQCPAVGNDTNGCELLITVTASSAGAATAWTVATASPDQGPFDGVEDTLIGIVNSTSSPLLSITLTGSAGGIGIFGLDGDGACSGYTPGPPAAACGAGDPDTTGYGHAAYTDAAAHALVAVTFSGINGAGTTGTVNFGGTGVAAGAYNWFDLEGAITAQTITTTPEPGTFALLGIGLIGLGAVTRRRWTLPWRT